MPATPSQTVQAPAGKKVITVRTTAFKAAGEGGSAAIEKIAAAADPGLSQIRRARRCPNPNAPN